jgi:site-specific DNA-methyltransferase (adenine-specific)
MRQLVWACLPLGQGVILDPFMGSGSTIAAATALGLKSIGVEIRADYYRLSQSAIPKLAEIDTIFDPLARVGPDKSSRRLAAGRS